MVRVDLIKKNQLNSTQLNSTTYRVEARDSQKRVVVDCCMLLASPLLVLSTFDLFLSPHSFHPHRCWASKRYLRKRYRRRAMVDRAAASDEGDKSMESTRQEPREHHGLEKQEKEKMYYRFVKYKNKIKISHFLFK